MHRIEIKKGEKILNDLDLGTCAYIVETGKVSVEDRVSNRGTYVVNPGEMFGEYGVIEDARHYSNATALEDSLLVVVTQAEIEEKSASADPMISLFLNFFMGRCHSLTVRQYGSDEEVE
ncbi:MAG: Crp/Fnr family transcriptional regulator, partial [Sneathiella sp.]|nr:Crp/Fnr family transcriptional regulator [Sneathiella sp.]